MKLGVSGSGRGPQPCEHSTCAGQVSYATNAVSATSRKECPFGCEHSPFIELAFSPCTGLVVSIKPQSFHRVLWIIAGLAALPRLLFGVWVLPEEHWILGDDVRKYVSAFCAVTGSTANPSFYASLRLLE